MSARYTDQFLESVQRRLPELATPRDLVRCGLYRSAQAAYSARRSGKCPPYLRIPQRGIVYPKAGVVNFLRQFIHEPEKANGDGPPVRQWPANTQKQG